MAPTESASLAASAEALGRQARHAREPLDALLPRVERLAVDLAERTAPRPGVTLYAPERDATLLHLWRAARHAYQGGPGDRACGDV